VSKNPPLTEDQIPQSAEAEARHTAAQASRNSQLDYMIAEQRQQQAAAELEAIVGSEEDRFKAAANKMEDSANRTIEELDRRARAVGEEITQLLISSRSVRDLIAAESIARRGARAARGPPRTAPSPSDPHSVDQDRLRAAAPDRQRPRHFGPGASQSFPGAEPLTMKSVSHSDARWAAACARDPVQRPHGQRRPL
jgi:hypothetical protein